MQRRINSGGTDGFVHICAGHNCAGLCLLQPVGARHNPAMDKAVEPGFPLHHRVAGELQLAITGGSLRSGDRLPSVRALCQRHGVSA